MSHAQKAPGSLLKVMLETLQRDNEQQKGECVIEIRMLSLSIILLSQHISIDNSIVYERKKHQLCFRNA